MFIIELLIVFRCDSLDAHDYYFDATLADLDYTRRIENIANCSDDRLIEHTARLKLDRAPALWFPAGYGRQPLYTLNVTAFYRHRGNGKFLAALDREQKLVLARHSASLSRRLGFRRVALNATLVRADKPQFGRNFAFSVNEIPIFLKGKLTAV